MKGQVLFPYLLHRQGHGAALNCLGEIQSCVFSEEFFCLLVIGMGGFFGILKGTTIDVFPIKS